jgi:hypothetical protein
MFILMNNHDSIFMIKHKSSYELFNNDDDLVCIFMSITQIEMHQIHLFQMWKDKYSQNDVTHSTFNMIIKKGFGANNEIILCMNLYITETTPCSIIRTLMHL